MSAELSRLLALDRIGSRPVEISVHANPDELTAIATRLMIPAVLALDCSLTLRRETGRIAAEGTLAARVIRDCVVTLEPFEMEVRERFQVHFVREDEQTDDDDPLAPDQVPYTGSAIDVGEAAVEQLALALDPFPRRPDAVLEQPDEAPETSNPFAALACRGGEVD